LQRFELTGTGLASEGAGVERPMASLGRTVLLAVLASTPLVASLAAADAGIQVIVHRSVPGASIGRATLADIFLGNAQRWADGRPIQAVDLTATSPVREAFSRTVLGMPTIAVRAHWTRRIGNGQWPPPTRPTDAEVIAFVADHPGSVGYVSAGASLPPSVKPVALK
jgi:ABC-type phosphate transport system substrate-binding protein